MNLRDLRNALNALPLHDLTPTVVEEVDASKGRVEIDVGDFEIPAIRGLHSEISDLEDECGTLESRVIILEGALKNCAESMRALITALRLKPEDSETYRAALEALQR